MKLEVTRNVIADLWPLCRSGEATRDSETLVEQFLSGDTSFATILNERAQSLKTIPPVKLSPDAERRLLDDASRRARLKMMIIGGAVALAGLIVLLALGGALFLAIRGF